MSLTSGRILGLFFCVRRLLRRRRRPDARSMRLGGDEARSRLLDGEAVQAVVFRCLEPAASHAARAGGTIGFSRFPLGALVARGRHRCTDSPRVLDGRVLGEEGLVPSRAGRAHGSLADCRLASAAAYRAAQPPPRPCLTIALVSRIILFTDWECSVGRTPRSIPRCSAFCIMDSTSTPIHR